MAKGWSTEAVATLLRGIESDLDEQARYLARLWLAWRTTGDREALADLRRVFLQERRER